MDKLLLKELYYSVKKELGQEYEIRIQTVVKNNNQKLTGFVIRKGEEQTVPVIYVDSFLCRPDYNLSQAVDEIVALVRNQEIPPISANMLMDFNFVKERLRIKLINYEANQSLLEDIPHVKYLDLAIVFYLLIEENDEGQMTALVHNEHVEVWKTDMVQLYQIALSNMKEKQQPCLESLNYIMEDMVKDFQTGMFGDIMADFPEDGMDMYVLTNENGVSGAATILYSSELEKMADKFNCNIIIFPSSTHELILVKEEEGMEYAELSKMVQSINFQEVLQEDQLSNSVYLYDRSKKDIRIAFQGEPLR